MAVTIMHNDDLARKTEIYLGQLGVSRLLPDIWEAVCFEISMGPQTGTKWTKRSVARRYLEYLRDRTKASVIGDE